MATTKTNAITTTSQRAPRTKSASAPSHEQIAEWAYERWEDNGGTPEDNWLAAEAELTGQKKARAKSVQSPSR